MLQEKHSLKKAVAHNVTYHIHTFCVTQCGLHTTSTTYMPQVRTIPVICNMYCILNVPQA